MWKRNIQSIEMQHEVQDGKNVCIGFEGEYQKYISGEESKILREAKNCGGRETLYTMRDTTGGVFSCNVFGILPTPPQFVLGYKPPKAS